MAHDAWLDRVDFNVAEIISGECAMRGPKVCVVREARQGVDSREEIRQIKSNAVMLPGVQVEYNAGVISVDCSTYQVLVNAGVLVKACVSCPIRMQEQ